MSSAAVVPTWLVIVIAVATPALAFAGVVVANVVTRKGDSETESRSRREETMRTLKWAAELAVSSDEAQADLGLRELKALGDSTLLEPEQQTFIDAALASVYGDAKEQIEADEVRGLAVDVIVTTDDDAAGGAPSPDPVETDVAPVSSDSMHVPDGEGEDHHA